MSAERFERVVVSRELSLAERSVDLFVTDHVKQNGRAMLTPLKLRDEVMQVLWDMGWNGSSTELT